MFWTDWFIIRLLSLSCRAKSTISSVKSSWSFLFEKWYYFRKWNNKIQQSKECKHKTVNARQSKLPGQIRNKKIHISTSCNYQYLPPPLISNKQLVFIFIFQYFVLVLNINWKMLNMLIYRLRLETTWNKMWMSLTCAFQYVPESQHLLLW